MKKKWKNPAFDEGLKKMLLIMRLTAIFLFAGFMALGSSTYSQGTRLNFRLEKATLQEFFSKVEGISEFYFFYKDDEVDLETTVSLDIQNQTIDQILDNVLRETGLDYRIVDRYIVVSSNPMTNNALPNWVQQQVTIAGTVRNQAGEPIPGTTILVKGTLSGTITDVNGRFSMVLPHNAQVLVFSFVGMRSQEVAIDGKTVFEIILLDELRGIDEVVVIGYGTRLKKDLTGAVSQITSEEITRQVTMSPQMSMQGKMAGVFVSNPGSDPNSRPTIRIRGVSTLGYNDPLYVVDGIPLAEGGATEASARVADLRGSVNVFNMINPNDIESISVLKDASATAIYGVRASNGVILITTKRGSSGAVKVNMSANYGIQNINKRYDVSTMNEFISWTNEAWANNTTLTPNANYRKFFDANNPNYLGNSKDYTQEWLDATLVKNAPVQDYNLSVTGGNMVSNYAVGAGYSTQEDVIWKSSFDRYSFFLNSDHKLNKYFKVGESYRFVYSKAYDVGGSDLSVVFGAPWQPVYDSSFDDGLARVGRTVDNVFLSRGYGDGTRPNFRSNELYNYMYRNLLRNMGSFYAEFTPFDGFRVKGTFSFDTYTNTQERYMTDERGLFENIRGIPYTLGTDYRRRINENVNIVKEMFIGYTKILGKHNVDIVLNAMDQKVDWNNTQASISSNSTITSWEQRRIEEGWPATSKGLLYERTPQGLQGYMGRFSYHFNSKYYLDATIRRDGTSKFGTGYKWGTFPSFGAVWRISSESFMKEIAWISDLKVRGGWGKTGNQETRDYAFLSVVNYNPKYSLGTGALPGDGVINAAAVLGDFPIKDMSWETVTSTSLGIDAILFDNKLALTAEYYYRLTDGILQAISIPLVIGALNNPVVNLAEVENTGFEFQASYNNKIGKLGYNASFNLTTVKNNVLSLYRGQPSTSGNFRIEEGYPINFIYGYKTDGIFQNSDEVAVWKAQTTDPGRDVLKAPGDVRFVDLYGPPTANDPKGAIKSYAPDGRIDGNDQTYLGKTIPGYYYGMNMGADYNNWDVSIMFRGVGDVQRINTDGKQSIGASGGNFLAAYRDRWTPTNPSTVIPRAINGDPSGNNRISDRHVEDAGFLRLQQVQVGYNIQGNLLQKLGFNSMRCYLSGTNLFVVTPYSGLDPENDTTPTTYSIGVNLNF